MTIAELRIQLDLQPENRISILKGAASKCSNGYLFVDSSDGHCYLFNRNGNEDDVKKIKSIENNAFWGCDNLKSIAIPDSVESIGNYVFAYCRSLKSIEIPDFVKSIGYWVFWGCENIKSLTFKGKTIDQVKAMKNYPFGIEDESYPFGIGDESIIKCI